MTLVLFNLFHDLFQNSKWFLLRLEKAVPSFTDSVRPVCLAVPDFIDYPPCPDISMVFFCFFFQLKHGKSVALKNFLKTI